MEKTICKIGPLSAGFFINSKEVNIKNNQIVEITINEKIGYLYKIKSRKSYKRKNGFSYYYQIIIPKVIMEKAEFKIGEKIHINIR